MTASHLLWECAEAQHHRQASILHACCLHCALLDSAALVTDSPAGVIIQDEVGGCLGRSLAGVQHAANGVDGLEAVRAAAALATFSTLGAKITLDASAGRTRKHCAPV